MDVPDAVLDQFAPSGPLTAVDVEAAMRRFKKALIERALGGELTHHLGYPPGGTKPETTTNHRNGTSGKTVLTDHGSLELAIPRDRAGTFEPALIPTHARRFTGFDDKILALYARGLTVREIQAFLGEMYAVDVSPDLISAVTDAVHAEVTAWAAAGARADVSGGVLRLRCGSKCGMKAQSAAPDADRAEAATKLIWLALRNITATWCAASTTFVRQI